MKPVPSMRARANRAHCPICGRERLSREELGWQRDNGLAVWRCQHRRPSPSLRAELLDAAGVIAALLACICVMRTLW